VLDITPNDPSVIAAKAGIYQAQGRLQEAGTLLSGIEEQIFTEEIVLKKITQLRLERNYGEAIRLLETRQSQFHSATEYEKVFVQMKLAFLQRLAGDTVGATITAKQARHTFEQLHKDPSDAELVGILSVIYATIGDKDLAVKEAERAIIKARGVDRLHEVGFQENLAQIQTMLGDTSRAIPTLAQLLRTPYFSPLYVPAPVTAALLRLDPMWDPLRGDPAFQKLCEEKQP
jgi:serine/threonine-protein kinase